MIAVRQMIPPMNQKKLFEMIVTNSFMVFPAGIAGETGDPVSPGRSVSRIPLSQGEHGSATSRAINDDFAPAGGRLARRPVLLLAWWGPEVFRDAATLCSGRIGRPDGTC